jgi:hypothetical protein
MRLAIAGRRRQERNPLKKPTILLFGDSHSYAIKRAVEKREGKGRPVPLAVHRLAKLKNGKRQGDTTFEDFLELIGPLGPEDVVLSAIGGNQHAVFSTIQHPSPFDFIEPGGQVELDGSAELIPYRVLSQVFEKGIRNGDGKSLEALRKATSARVVHLIPPPPKKDNAFIQNYHETHFASEGITAHGVSSPGLRLKFWTLQTTLLKDLCAQLGIEVMMPPAAALDEKGFLATDFYANDATHANHHYGELVLRQVERDYLTGAVAEGAVS